MHAKLMQLLVTGFLMTGCSAADSAGEVSGDVPVVRIATYNIHHWVGSDEEVDITRIARVIDELDADVIAIQEADNNLLPDGELRRQELLEQLVHHRWVRFDDKGDEVLSVHGNGLLVAPHVDVVSADWVDVSEAGRDPRAFTETVLRLHGDRVRVVGAHFGLNNKERQRQIATLATRLWHSETELDGTVLVGDFNEWNPLARTFRPIRSILQDLGSARSFPASGPLFRLDRIFASPDADVVSIDVVRSGESVGASDHLPVRAQLVF